MKCEDEQGSEGFIKDWLVPFVAAVGIVVGLFILVVFLCVVFGDYKF